MNLNLERKKRWSSQSFHQKEILTKCMLIKTQLGWSSLLTPKAMQFTAASSLTWRIWALVRFEWSPIHPLPYSLPQDFFIFFLSCSSDFFIHIYCVYFISIYHSLKKKNYKSHNSVLKSKKIIVLQSPCSYKFCSEWIAYSASGTGAPLNRPSLNCFHVSDSHHICEQASQQIEFGGHWTGDPGRIL